MSRIDEALRRWERARGAETFESGAAPPASSAALKEYPHEAADQQADEVPDPRAGEEPAPPGSADASQSFQRSPVSRNGAGRGTRIPGEAALQARLVSGAPTTLSLEQYRRLAAVLLEEQVERQIKTVMITSALPGEGKTLTVVNLALTLGESYARRVLVIDADLRRPSLHAFLGIPNERGLTEALRDAHNPLPFVEVSTHLSVLTAGHPGPTPLAGLTSLRMGEILKESAASFDWVLIDTPPVGVLPDAQVLARFAGAVVFVIAAGATPAATVERAFAELGGPDAIFGTVLNRVEDRRVPDVDHYGGYGT